MWDVFLESEEKNIIVVSDKIEISRLIEKSLYDNQGRYTIILDKSRLTQNNMVIGDLQIIHKIDDAVAYRNSEDLDVQGWVLFVSKEDGMLSSLSSVAYILENPHQKLLEFKMNEVGLSQKHVRQLSELISKDEVNEIQLKTALKSKNRSELVRALGIVYSDSEDLKKYNYDYREIIGRHLSDSLLLDETVKQLPPEQATHYEKFIERLNQSVIQDYNFKEELSLELGKVDIQELLASIDLPYMAPIKLSAKVRMSGNNFKRVNTKLFFHSPNDTQILIGLENTNGNVILSNGQRIQCQAGEMLDVTSNESILNVKITGEVQTAGSLTYTFYSVCAENEGAFILDKSRLIGLTPSQSNYNLSNFSQNTVVYVVHHINDVPRCDDAQVDRLFQSGEYCLAQLTAFNSEESSISITLREYEYTILGFNLNDSETVVLRDGVEKKRLSGLDFGNRIFSVVDSNSVHELEKVLLSSSSLNIIKSYNSKKFNVQSNPVYCSEIDQFDVEENKCDLNASELLHCWDEIKEMLLTFEYKPSAYIALIREIGHNKISLFYDLYTESLNQNFIQTSRFLTIATLKDSKVQSIVLPFFHPVVLFDLHKFFENYTLDDRISLNAHHLPSFLKSVWMNNETFVALENTGIFQPVFVHERCNLFDLKSDLQLNEEANTFSRFRPVNDDQILRSFDAMFDYHGFSRVFHVRLLIDTESELRRLISLIISDNAFRDRLKRSTLFIHLSETLFDGLITYYTQGHDSIKLARSESTTEYNLLIDARQSDDVKYSNRPSSSELTPNFLSAGVPIFPYQESGSSSVPIIYPQEFKAHQRLGSPANQNLTIVGHSKDREIDEYRRAKIISLQNERFNLLSNSLSHLVYEMRSVSRLRYSSHQITNFVIAIKGTKQLRARLAHGLSEYNIVEHIDKIEKGLLQENLFSFNHMFGNRNKMKGIVGELITFKAIDRLCYESKAGYLLPLDPIISELQLYLRATSKRNWLRYPDFLLLRFKDEICYLHFIEVKSRLECDYQNVVKEQIDPIRKAMVEWIEDTGSSGLERRRFVSFLIEYLMKVMLDKLPLARLESVYDWISTSSAKIQLHDSLLVHLSESDLSRVEHHDEYMVAHHSYRAALSEFLEMSDNNALSKSLEILFESIDNINNPTKIKDSSDLEYRTVQPEKDILESSDNINGADSDLHSITFDLRRGREHLYSGLEAAYGDVQRKLGREGIYLKDSDNRVKLSPMNVRFSYSTSEGMSIRNVKSKSPDIALWLKLPQGQSVDIDSDMGNIIMEYPLPAASRMFFGYSEISHAKTRTDELSVPIGVDEDGKVVVFEFGSNSPHLLIGGTTGSGKSVALETIVGGLLSKYDFTELNVVIVDPKQTELVDFEVARAVRENCLNAPIGFNADHAIKILTSAVAEMERRNDLFASMSRELKSRSKITRSLKDFSEYNQKTLGEKLPRILIVLDEYADLVNDPAKKKELQSHLVRIAQKGRSTGIHLIVATQKPVVEVIDTVVKSNLPASLALRVSKLNDSIVIMDEGGAEGLLGQGDAYLKIGGQKIRLQIARFGEDQFEMLS